jgi:hypothetical protein
VILNLAEIADGKRIQNQQIFCIHVVDLVPDSGCGTSTPALRSGFGDIVKTTVAIASFKVAVLNTLSD